MLHARRSSTSWWSIPRFFQSSYDRAGADAADRSQRKDKKYKDLAEALDYLFTDFAVETYERMSDAARKVINMVTCTNSYTVVTVRTATCLGVCLWIIVVR